MSYGTGMLDSPQAVSEEFMCAKATMAYHFGHRYAKVKEGIKDRLTWHAGVLLEWDHALFTTVVELGWLRGVGGYRGKSNWCEDKNAKRSKMLDSLPDCMKGPWDSSISEIRITDHPAKNVNEFKAYMAKYTGPQERFLDPEIRNSGTVRLTNRTLRDIYKALLNYDRHYQGDPGDVSYSEISFKGDVRNCQSFAADFFRHLTGQMDTKTVNNLMNKLYTPHTEYFIYDYKETKR